LQQELFIAQENPKPLRQILLPLVGDFNITNGM
jgi:hypothetical protein